MQGTIKRGKRMITNSKIYKEIDEKSEVGNLVLLYRGESPYAVEASSSSEGYKKLKPGVFQDITEHDSIKGQWQIVDTEADWSEMTSENDIISVLCETISSLKKTLDYNGYYIAYLLDQLSEEEFEKIAKEFSFTPKPYLDKELKKKIKILFTFTGERFTPSDISDIFVIDETKAEEILQEMDKENYL